MSNIYILIAVALVAGAVIPVQGAANNKLAIVLGNPILAALLSFAVGTLSLFLYVVFSGTPLLGIAGAKNASAMAWTGGLFGAFFVAATVTILPRLGIAATFGLVVAGQMVFSLVIDHFGLLGVDVRPVSIQRIAGIALITAGVVLIRKF